MDFEENEEYWKLRKIHLGSGVPTGGYFFSKKDSSNFEEDQTTEIGQYKLVPDLNSNKKVILFLTILMNEETFVQRAKLVLMDIKTMRPLQSVTKDFIEAEYVRADENETEVLLRHCTMEGMKFNPDSIREG
jgi:hypothetical protein